MTSSSKEVASTSRPDLEQGSDVEKGGVGKKRWGKEGERHLSHEIDQK